jgi:hypothetical protein
MSLKSGMTFINIKDKDEKYHVSPLIGRVYTYIEPSKNGNLWGVFEGPTSYSANQYCSFKLAHFTTKLTELEKILYNINEEE